LEEWQLPQHQQHNGSADSKKGYVAHQSTCENAHGEGDDDCKTNAMLDLYLQLF
jgi:hypothetical protein